MKKIVSVFICFTMIFASCLTGFAQNHNAKTESVLNEYANIVRPNED